MQQPCPQCGLITDPNSRFCTNCGAVREPVQAYRQSWESPSQNQGQVPPWAQVPGGAYQQQSYMANQNSGGSLGFGGQGDATAKKWLMIVGITIGSALLLLIVCITLALITPAPISTFFWVVTVIIFITAWIIYSFIRNIIRRTVGRIWRFF